DQRCRQCGRGRERDQEGRARPPLWRSQRSCRRHTRVQWSTKKKLSASYTLESQPSPDGTRDGSPGTGGSAMILVTGASGNVGSELARALTARAVAFRAMVRSPEAAKSVDALASAELVPGDFNDSATVENALIGVKRAFLLTNSSERAEEQQCAFVEAAQRAGVGQIVKLSQLAADRGSPVRF